MRYWDRMVDPDKRSRGRDRQSTRGTGSTSESFEKKGLFERTDSEEEPQENFLDESVTVPGLFPTDRSPGSRGSNDDPEGVDKKISAAVDAITLVITDHGALTGLADDDHSAYLNNTRGDARYFRENEHINSSAGAGDSGKPIKLDATGLVDVSMVKNVATHAKAWYIPNPTAAGNYDIRGIPKAATLKYASYITDTGTVTFNVEKRTNATPLTAGTDIWSSDKTATSSSANTASFNSGAITARDFLWVAITSVASAPTEFVLYLEWEVD